MNRFALVCRSHFIKQPEDPSVAVEGEEPCLICGKLIRQSSTTLTILRPSMRVHEEAPAGGYDITFDEDWNPIMTKIEPSS